MSPAALTSWCHLVVVFSAIAASIYLVMFAVSRFGWTQLAATYAAPVRPADGLKFRWCNGRAGSWMDYTSLEVSVDAEGIFIAINGGFRMFHPPILLPWTGVRSVAEERNGFFRRATIRFADCEGRRMVLFLPVIALADIRAASGRRDFSGEGLR